MIRLRSKIEKEEIKQLISEIVNKFDMDNKELLKKMLEELAEKRKIDVDEFWFKFIGLAMAKIFDVIGKPIMLINEKNGAAYIFEEKGRVTAVNDHRGKSVKMNASYTFEEFWNYGIFKKSYQNLFTNATNVL